MRLTHHQVGPEYLSQEPIKGCSVTGANNYYRAEVPDFCCGCGKPTQALGPTIAERVEYMSEGGGRVGKSVTVVLPQRECASCAKLSFSAGMGKPVLLAILTVIAVAVAFGLAFGVKTGVGRFALPVGLVAGVAVGWALVQRKRKAILDESWAGAPRGTVSKLDMPFDLILDIPHEGYSREFARLNPQFKLEPSRRNLRKVDMKIRGGLGAPLE